MDKQSPMPKFYVQPHGVPVKWQDEQTGTLPNAIKSYFAHMTDGSKPFQGVQFALVRDWLRYYISAPCWKVEGNELEELRGSVMTLKTPEEMAAWVMRCVNIGIDPF